jgi:hypothetical protein
MESRSSLLTEVSTPNELHGDEKKRCSERQSGPEQIAGDSNARASDWFSSVVESRSCGTDPH